MNLLVKHTEVEGSLIGKLLMDNRFIAGVAEILSVDDFSVHDYGKVYGVILSQWAAGHNVDPYTTAAELDSDLADVPIDCYSATGSAQGAMYHAEQIRDASTRRRLYTEATRIAKQAKTDDTSIVDILSSAKDSLNVIGHVEAVRTTTDIIMGVVEASQEAAKSEHGTVGIPTGFKTLDNVTGGLKDTDLIIIAARPSVGKSALAVNVIHNIVDNTDKKVCLFSLEMSSEQVWLRIISSMTGIDNNRLSRGDLAAGDWAKYTDAAQKCVDKYGSSVYLDEKARATPGHILAIAKQKQQQGLCDVVVVDYLNLMHVPGEASGYSTVTAASAAMKDLAKDMKIPVVLLAQLSREAEGRGEMNAPALSDLKMSGGIEEVADIVIFPHRARRDSPRGEIIVAKQRNGPIGNFSVSFDGPTTTYREE